MIRPDEIVSRILKKNGPFPNNPKLPVLIYKNALDYLSTDAIMDLFAKNGWHNAWVNGIYPFHHFHRNVHEALAVSSGQCDVQLGGENGACFSIEKNDVLILPAGTSHKKISSSTDFTCVGAYPWKVPYDMWYGKEGERPEEKIKTCPLPEQDPVYGGAKPLFDYWKG